MYQYIENTLKTILPQRYLASDQYNYINVKVWLWVHILNSLSFIIIKRVTIKSHRPQE